MDWEGLLNTHIHTEKPIYLYTHTSKTAKLTLQVKVWNGVEGKPMFALKEQK